MSRRARTRIAWVVGTLAILAGVFTLGSLVGFKSDDSADILYGPLAGAIVLGVLSATLVAILFFIAVIAGITYLVSIWIERGADND